MTGTSDEVDESQSSYADPVPTREEWESVAEDPDLQEDLGYEMIDWEVIRAPSHSDHVVFLPSEEAMLRDDAFIVAGPKARRKLESNR